MTISGSQSEAMSRSTNATPTFVSPISIPRCSRFRGYANTCKNEKYANRLGGGGTKRSKTRMVTTTPSDATANARSEDVSKLPTGLFDVIVVGAGPAGLSLSASLGERGVKVLCVDPALDRKWPNNYGTWLDELSPLGLDDCASHVWPNTSVYTGSSDEKTILLRPYARIDRTKLKRRLMSRCEESKNVEIERLSATNLDTTNVKHSRIRLTDNFGNATDVCSRVVVDATGHALRFVKRGDGVTPAYQAAYGIDCELAHEVSDSYNPNEMLLMDFRDTHMQNSAQDSENSTKEPSFLYVMPMGGRRVFLEETSLVERTAMSFEELKSRLYKRLSHDGVRIEKVHEIEHSLIPMGGTLPCANQRVVAFGGAASFVHPATGYMIARALTLSNTVADGISFALNNIDLNADLLSRQIWRKTWSEQMLRQRDFLVYGMNFLTKVDVHAMREFFDAFFKLPQYQWAGYLSFRLEEPVERLWFALAMFFHASLPMKAALVWDSFTSGGLPFFLSVLPLNVRYHMPDTCAE